MSQELIVKENLYKGLVKEIKKIKKIYKSIGVLVSLIEEQLVFTIYKNIAGLKGLELRALSHEILSNYIIDTEVVNFENGFIFNCYDANFLLNFKELRYVRYEKNGNTINKFSSKIESKNMTIANCIGYDVSYDYLDYMINNINTRFKVEEKQEKPERSKLVLSDVINSFANSDVTLGKVHSESEIEYDFMKLYSNTCNLDYNVYKDYVLRLQKLCVENNYNKDITEFCRIVIQSSFRKYKSENITFPEFIQENIKFNLKFYKNNKGEITSRYIKCYGVEFELKNKKPKKDNIFEKSSHREVLLNSTKLPKDLESILINTVYVSKDES